MAHQPPSGWHAEDIKAGLRKRFGSLAALSVSWGYASSAVSQAIRGTNHSRPIERRIAKALDVHPHVLWPDRWNAAGLPLPRRVSRPGKPTPTPEIAHRQIGKAA